MTEKTQDQHDTERDAPESGFGSGLVVERGGRATRPVVRDSREFRVNIPTRVQKNVTLSHSFERELRTVPGIVSASIGWGFFITVSDDADLSALRAQAVEIIRRHYDPEKTFRDSVFKVGFVRTPTDYRIAVTDSGRAALKRAISISTRFAAFKHALGTISKRLCRIPGVSGASVDDGRISFRLAGVHDYPPVWARIGEEIRTYVEWAENLPVMPEPKPFKAAEPDERTRELHRLGDEYALMRERQARPLSQKIDEAETLADLKPILREILSRLPPGEND